MFSSRLLVMVLVAGLGFASVLSATELPPEKSLWPADFKNTITYDLGEVVSSRKANPSAPSRLNRVFSNVSKPTYTIHQADPKIANGVGLVICPGGGYRDVWLDREGHDLAIVLQKHGITSLVLKYRTNSGEGDNRAHEWDDYLPAVEADARRGLKILREQSKTLNVNPKKVGVSGFSAGGNLAILVALNKPHDGDASGKADFAGLFYPWLRDQDYSQLIKDNAKSLPPMFIMNAVDDRTTPADKCIEFYSHLLKAGVKSELHLYGQGGHGFDLGIGRGETTSTWPTTFVGWLKDRGFANK